MMIGESKMIGKKNRGGATSDRASKKDIRHPKCEIDMNDWNGNPLIRTIRNHYILHRPHEVDHRPIKL
jgi:hypothetical protein